MKVIRERGWGPHPTEEQKTYHDGLWLRRWPCGLIDVDRGTFPPTTAYKAIDNKGDPCEVTRDHMVVWEYGAYHLNSEGVFSTNTGSNWWKSPADFIGFLARTNKYLVLERYSAWYVQACRCLGIPSSRGDSFARVVAHDWSKGEL